MENENKRVFWSVGRLVIGILSIILFVVIAFQSCTAGVSNILEESDSISGTSGLFLAVFMLAGGIVVVATRKSIKKGGCIASGILFLIATILGATSWNSTYADLQIWVIISLIVAVFYIFCAIMQGRTNKKAN